MYPAELDPKTELKSRPSAHAPYWYVDADTDSAIEVKSSLALPLTLLPLLTTLD
jgi:hypothetical protein